MKTLKWPARPRLACCAVSAARPPTRPAAGRAAVRQRYSVTDDDGRRQTPNVKILVLSHPFGDLGVTHMVYLWLDGKRVVDFLLALIEFFSLAFMAAVDGDVARNPSMHR